MKLALFAALLVGMTTVGVHLAGAAPATWSIQRLSVGADAKAGIFSKDGVEESRFLPGVYASWSAATNLSIAGTFERDFASELSIGQVGARVRVLDTDRGDIAGGVNLVAYADKGAAGIEKPTSYNISLNGAWDAIRAKNGQTQVWLIGSVSNDPQNGITAYRVGLRYQAVGGAPIREPEPLP